MICFKKNNNHAGFTLIEVILAMLILAVLALGGGALLSRVGETVAIQENKRAAIEVASQQLEKLRSGEDLVVGSFVGSVGVNGQVRSIQTDVFDVGNSARPLKQVLVRVEYRAGGNWVSLETNMNK